MHLPGDKQGAGLFEWEGDFAVRVQCLFEGSLGAG
jgi:hypothetical protein